MLHRRKTLNILLIANQQRLQHLVAEAASLPGVTLRMATTLADLPADISSAPPELLLLQNRLSGLSAEILSRHIKKQLSEPEKTTLVVLTESAGDAPEEITIETAVTDEELLAAVAALIAKGREENNALPEIPVDQPVVAVSLEGPAPVADADLEAGCSVVTDSHPADASDVVSLGNVAAVGTAATKAPVTAHTPPLKFQEELDSLTGGGIAPDQPGASADLRRPATGRGKWRWPIICSVAIAVATFIFLSTRVPPPAPVAQPGASPPETAEKVPAGKREGIVPPDAAGNTKTAPAPGENVSPAPPPSPDREKSIRRTELPRFIPPQSRVPEGNTKPGWEKYVTASFEFRVFRQDREIKALQAIDLTGEGMSRSFFTRAILEMSGARDYRLLSKEIKGEYLVKKGSLAANAGVILYKKKDDTQLKAFVIHYQ